ncbi:MAG: hypothetical protein EBS07_09535 [Sphingobacteriia bacterium]|nr:hypothetical protein [Sphingobacteriia bacterium]
MKKVFKISFWVSLFILGTLYGQTPFFSLTYDHFNGYETGASVIQVNDGYVISGGSNDSLGYQGIFIAKINEYGELLWWKQYSDSSRIYYIGGYGGMIMLEDSSFAICGSVKEINNNTNSAMLFCRFDKSGDTLYTLEFGGTGWDAGYMCKKAKNGGFFLGGTTDSYGDINGNMFLVKIDSVGNIQWQKEYGYANATDEGFSMVVDSYGCG